MRYLADILTFMRLILALILLIWGIAGGPAEVALILFLAAELTDALDGACSEKWPFPKNKTPKYRQYAAKFDMVIDAFLAVSIIIYYILQINIVLGLIIGIGYSIFAAIIDLIVYRKFFGHPDSYRSGALIAHNFVLAKKLILARRSVYIIGIIVISILILFATSWATSAKITILIIAAAIGIILWKFLGQRRRHISRDAVKIEKKLEKK